MVRKELSNLYSVEWRHKCDDVDREELLGHYHDVWCRGHGVILHSPEAQDAALALAPYVVESGWTQDVPQWFQFLHQLDVLASQAAWLVLHMVAFNRLPVDSPLDNNDLKQPLAGSLVGSLSWVPACAATMAYSHLTRQACDWLSNDTEVVAAQESLQLLTGSASRNRRKTYPVTLKGMSALVADFGKLSPGLLLPGPWVSPELSGARFPASDDVLLPLDQGVGNDAPLVSFLNATTPVTEEIDIGRQETRLMMQDILHRESVSCADPAAILVAMLAREIARKDGQPSDAVYLRPGGWVVDLAREQEELPLAAKRRWLTEWADRFDHNEADWRRAAEVMKQPRRGFPLVITANRSEPQWCSKPEFPVRALDRYWADTAEINPRQQRCLAIAGLNVETVVPDSAELLQTDGLRQARLLEADTGPVAFGACLANQEGLNLLLASDDEASAMESVLMNALAFTEAQTLDDEPAPWLGLPVVTCYQENQSPGLAEALLEAESEVVRIMFPPDANSAMNCLKAVYGVPGVVSLLCLPDARLPVLSPEQSGELVRNGALCLSGHCAAELQLVACGGLALAHARLVSRRLKAQGRPHSLVYVLEPARLSKWFDDHDNTGLLFPEHIRQRLLISDLSPEGWLGSLSSIKEDTRTRLVHTPEERRELLIGELAF